jgi:hypothetical protein
MSRRAILGQILSALAALARNATPVVSTDIVAG